MKLLSLLLACACTAAAASVHASETPRRTVEPAEAVLFSSDFESEDWFTSWGVRSKPRNTEIVSADPERKFEPHRGKALRVEVLQGGHNGTSVEYRFKRRHGQEPEEIYFRYYLRLGDSWKPLRGGKFPGIAGTYGRVGWGGRPVNGSDGWSARGHFEGQKDGRTPIGFYCYHMDMRGQYGSQWIWEQDQLGYLENNRWYCIEQFVKLNTPGESDGVMRGWIDGKLAFEKTDVRFRSVDTLKIEMIWLNVYYGGSWVAPRDMHLYVDDLVISRKPIGPVE